MAGEDEDAGGCLGSCDASSHGGYRSPWRAVLPAEHRQTWSAEHVDAAAHPQEKVIPDAYAARENIVGGANVVQ